MNQITGKTHEEIVDIINSLSLGEIIDCDSEKYIIISDPVRFLETGDRKCLLNKFFKTDSIHNIVFQGKKFKFGKDNV